MGVLKKYCAELSHLEPSPNHRLINGSSKVLRVGGTWRTPYGRVLANFWRTHTSSERKSVEEGPSSQSSITTRIAIHPNGNCVPLRIVLDLDPRLNPSARITYQATIPNNSEIFSIIEHGELEDLVKALENKTASLTDRDEEGRSLLNVSQVALSFLKQLTLINSTPNIFPGSTYLDSCSKIILTLMRLSLMCMET